MAVCKRNPQIKSKPISNRHYVEAMGVMDHPAHDEIEVLPETA
jgi:hypothetical protein